MISSRDTNLILTTIPTKRTSVKMVEYLHPITSNYTTNTKNVCILSKLNKPCF